MFGIAVTVGGTVVVGHASETQHVVSLSTLDAEYIAAGDGVKEPFFMLFCLSLLPRRVGQALRSLRTTRGLRC